MAKMFAMRTSAVGSADYVIFLRATCIADVVIPQRSTARVTKITEKRTNQHTHLASVGPSREILICLEEEGA